MLYIAFAWSDYEERGGMDDCCYIGDNLAAALAEVEAEAKGRWCPPRRDLLNQFIPGRWVCNGGGEVLCVETRRIMRLDDVAGDEHAPRYLWSDWEPFGITV